MTGNQRLQTVKTAVTTTLRGIGQVMFQDNALSGLLMLFGIALSSWQAAAAALAGNVISNISARYAFRCPKEDIANGLYGFNGTLTGIAAWTFFGGAGIVTSSVLAVLITMLFSRFKKPGYTAPFILSIWILLATSSLFGLPQALPGSGDMPVNAATEPDMFQALCRNFGQIMFQGSALTGILFLAGIAVNSRRGALYALYGAALPLFAAMFPNDYFDFNNGIWGYNAILCAIALAGPTLTDFTLATTAIILSTLLQWLGMTAGITTLTAPFVIATWLTLFLKKPLSPRNA